jgi:tricarballylate dehydrogenase
MKKDKCDVVVVGFGNAAQAAAYSAHSAGAKVVVLEKAPEKKRGGNTWFSSGAQFRHAHNGLEDEKPLLPQISDDEFDKIDLDPYTKDDFYADLMRVTRGKAVPELAELLVNESYPTVKWMRGAGIDWEILYTGSVPEGDRFRWHHGQSFIHSKDGGAGLVQMWQRILEDNGIEIRFDTAAVSLKTDEKGGISGIVTQDSEGLMEIQCNGVVLACGGFEANPAMRRQFLGEGTSERCAAPSSTPATASRWHWISAPSPSATGAAPIPRRSTPTPASTRRGSSIRSTCATGPTATPGP